MQPIIKIADLSKTYATGFHALKAINLEIRRGEIFALLGPNGAGKTTLINIICGIVNPSGGTILADGHEVDVLRGGDGEARYRRCSTTHHHHLVCRSCGRTVEVEGPTVERWATTVAQQHGYADVSHTLEIFGVCASCR